MSKRKQKDVQLCEWFALCVRPATTRRAHPINPDGVPICKECNDKVERLGR